MSKSFKVAALLAVTALIFAAPVFAQTPAELESNMSKATAGVFTSDVDDSMDVHDFSGLKIDKWFGFIGYGGDIGTTPYVDYPASLGYANQFSGLYLGLWYTGNVLRVDKGWTETVTKTYNTASQLLTTTQTQYSNPGTSINSNNQLEVLLGIGGMGFKIGFYEDVTENKRPNKSPITVTEYHQNGTVQRTAGEIVEYSSVSGTILPSLTWGMNLDLGSFAIKPLVAVGIDINLDSLVNDTRRAYNTVNGEIIGDKAIDRQGNNSGYVRPDFKIGADFDLANFTIEFAYGLGFSVYNNKYDASGFLGRTKGTVEWNGSTTTNTSIATTITTDNADLTINDQSAFDHSIFLGFLTEKEVFDGFKLGLYAGAEFGISTSASDAYDLTLSKTSTKQNNAALSAQNTTTETENRTFGTTTDTTRFSVDPFVRIGASYALIPQLTINAGVALLPLAYTSALTRTSTQAGDVTKSKTYNNKGNVTAESVTVTADGTTTDRVAVNNTWNYFRAGIFGGLVFNFTEKLALDTSFGWITPGSVGSDDFNLSFTTLNVLLAFKF